MKNIIVISTSLRHGSNSDMLAEKFLEGALSTGNRVEKISLIGKNIQFCRGCMACYTEVMQVLHSALQVCFWSWCPR